MNTTVFSVVAVLLFCLAADGHYLPARHHWSPSFHYPSVHRMKNHGFIGHSAPFSSFQTHPSAFQTHPSAFQTHPSAIQAHGPAFQAPESRPAFPAPGSITGPGSDQAIDVLTSLLLFRDSPGLGALGLLRAF